ncbi:hypothetical protein EGW08_012784 [Elysia chlorotica]|uniref:Uncharacterized protein n=1 Tax=Elysia chlorotica TaxID=188477 RepID=A0A3S0ZI59_ELYCH|nr:hypothetical protein EGW08_012784 [Elysia chlorotica]
MRMVISDTGRTVIFYCKSRSRASNMDDKTLVAAVEKREALYDKGNNYNSNRIFMQKQWADVGLEVGEEGISFSLCLSLGVTKYFVQKVVAFSIYQPSKNTVHPISPSECLYLLKPIKHHHSQTCESNYYRLHLEHK